MRAMSIIKYVFSILGALMLVGAIGFYSSTQKFLSQAVHADGTVIEMIRVRSTDNSSDTFKPRVEFQTESGQQIEFTTNSSSNPPSYSEGEKVDVLYLAESPREAKINGYFSLWGASLILGIMGAVFFSIGLGLFVVPILLSRKANNLKATGIPVQTKFQGVERNQALSVNGKNPYQIVSQWQNPATSKLHVFKSANIWFDPTDFVTTTEIKVYVERNNPKKYYMDISFLPELAS